MRNLYLDDIKAETVRDKYKRLNYHAMDSSCRVQAITFLRNIKGAIESDPRHYIAGVVDILNLEYPRVSLFLRAETFLEKIWWEAATEEDNSREACAVYGKIAHAMALALDDGCDFYQCNADVLNTRVQEIVIEEEDWRKAQKLMEEAAQGLTSIEIAIRSMDFFEPSINIKDALAKLIVYTHEHL